MSRNEARVRRMAVGFFLHAPGLFWVEGYRIRGAALVLNILAAVGTLGGMAFMAATGRGFGAVLGVWLAGHVVWGACLALLVFFEAGEP